MAQWAHYSTPDPEFEALGIKEPVVLSTATVEFTVDNIPKLRKQLNEANEARNRTILDDNEALKNGLTVRDYSIPVDDGNTILSRVYVPEARNDDETFPVVIDFHGGGQSFGSLADDDIKCRTLCVNQRVVAVNVDYRLAPEHRYPTNINDGYHAIRWVLEHASNFRGNPSKGFILLGVSAGAYIICLITQRARNDPVLQGKITGQVLQLPPTAGPGGIFPEKFADKILSYEQNKNDPLLPPSILTFFREVYKSPPPNIPEVSPILAESFKGLPPAVFQVAGGDQLRDEGLLYHKFLEESGIPTKLHVYPGVPHGFSTYFKFLKASEKWEKDLEDGIRWLMENGGA